MAAASVLLEADEVLPSFLELEQQKDLLRFTTAGSVDDGKSTLIGRLLYDSRNVYEDQLESVTKASVGRNAGAIDFSLLTDGLRAEREQGITIDVAYRYFATPRRKFIIADTPGHEQYTRNMVTGASTAELAIVLVDARKGLLPQSRRHAYISSLLGLRHLVVAINKMDLVDYDEHVFDRIEVDFRHFLSQFQSLEPYFVPISALIGDNVVTRSGNMSWFRGPSLLEYLEQVPVGNRALDAPFRFPVQRVVRPNLDFRGYAGTVASGVVRQGDKIGVLPSGREAIVSSIVTFDGEKQEAHAGESVTLTLDREIDIIRGDMIAAVEQQPLAVTAIEATIVWMSETPAQLKKRYRLKHATTLQWADLTSIEYRLNINTLEHEHASALEMNAIASVHIETARPIAFDPYQANRTTGSFILIDPATNATVAAGMITGRVSAPQTGVGRRHHLAAKAVSDAERQARQGHIGAAIRLDGRGELAWRLERALFQRGCTVFAFESQPWDVTSAFVRAGVIVVLTGAPGDGLSVVTAAGPIDTIYEEALPLDISDALHAINQVLERSNVFLSTPAWGDSGGI